jgi:chromosome partitioning protein
VTRKVVVGNFKGDVGKTTVAANAAVGLARSGKHVLLVDTDSQVSATDAPGLDGRANSGAFGLVVSGEDPGALAVEVEPNLEMICASCALAGVDSWLAMQTRREDILKKRLHRLSGYDYVMVDTAPAFSLLNLNALAWAEEVWIPVNMEYVALSGVRQVLDNLRIVNEELEHDVRVRYVIPTFVDRRNSKTQAVLDALHESFGPKVTTGIRSSVRPSEAPSHHQSIFDHAPKSSGSEDFEELVRRIIADE